MLLDCAIEPVDASDWTTIVALLAQAGLPPGGLADQFPKAYLRARTSRDGVIGVGAVEQYGRYGLLRSLAVHRQFQSFGVGRQLVQHLQHKARTLGLSEVYLLTETSAEFFLARGFVSTPRSQAPSAIACSPQFANICPATAQCLVWPGPTPVKCR